MAFKDIIRSLGGRKEQKELVPAQGTDKESSAAERFPIVRADEVDINRYKKVPLASLAALGAAFSQLPDAARTMISSFEMVVPGNGMLFYGNRPAGAKGTLQMKDHITLGRIVNEKGRYMDHMEFREIEHLPVTQTTTSVLPYDPASMVVAAALVSIEHKLDSLQETADGILRFLNQDKESKQKGSYEALSDAFADYRRDGGSEVFFKRWNEQIQTIKRESDQNIDFYRKQIADTMKGQKSLHGSQDAQMLLDGVLKDFHGYRLSCHLYAYASFLDVLAIRDFRTDSLNAVRERIRVRAQSYSQLYEQCHAQLGGYQRASMDAKLIGGLGSAFRAAGEKIGDIPILKEGPVDEAFVSIGEALGRKNRHALRDLLEQMEPIRDSMTLTFMNAMESIDRMQNCPQGLLFDAEYLYFLENEASE